MKAVMRPLMMGLVALVMALTAITVAPQQAEARKGRWIAAGVAAAVIGGVILSHRHHRRHHYYSSYDDYGYEPYYYPRYRYYRPSYAYSYGYYQRPRWRHRNVNYGYRHGGWGGGHYGRINGIGIGW